MLEISLDQLKQLLPGKLQESDYEIANGMSFKALCRKYQSVLVSSVSIKTAYDFFVQNVLSKYECIKLVGEGSSRTAFACIGGKCIKVAKVFAGVAQNKQEEKHTAQHWWKRNYDCFVRTYDHNEGYELLLSECCARFKNNKDFVAAFGLKDEASLKAAIRAVAQEKNHDIGKTATDLRIKCSTWRQSGNDGSDYHIDIVERAMAWLESLKTGKNQTAGGRSFMQIADFWKRHGIDELLPGDVYTYRNWGYAIRGDELMPVILDLGLSRKVADKFYS